MKKIRKLDTINCATFEHIKGGKGYRVVDIKTIFEIADKVNEIIDVLNSELFESTIVVPNKSQKQSKNKSNVEWKDGDILNTIDRDGLPHRFILNEMKEPKKKEDWEKELMFTYGHLYYQNEDGEFCMIANEIDDLIDFIRQLLLEMTIEVVKEIRGKFWEESEEDFGTYIEEKLSKLLKEEIK